MSRFHQRLNEDLQDPEFAEAFYDMSVDITLLQVLEEASKALNISEKELARRMEVQHSTVTRLFNASHFSSPPQPGSKSQTPSRLGLGSDSNSSCPHAEWDQ